MMNYISKQNIIKGCHKYQNSPSSMVKPTLNQLELEENAHSLQLLP